MHAWEAVIAWNSEKRTLMVFRLEDYQRSWRKITEMFPSDVGATFHDRAKARGVRAVAFVFIDFNTLVVRERIPVETVHNAFLEIDEYRHHMSPDNPHFSLDTSGDED